MTSTLKAGIALAALTGAVAMAGSATAADLGGPAGGSVKDGGYLAPLPEVSRGAGPCYFLGAVGGAFGQSPSITWPVNNITSFGFDNGNGWTETSRQVTPAPGSPAVTDTRIDSTAFGEFGFGCGTSLGGWRGVRGEVAFGFYGDRSIYGKPANFEINFEQDANVPPGPNAPPPDDPVNDDPLHSSLRSYTLMFNAYKDLGTFGRFTPYVGAGIGVAYHELDDVFFTDNPNLLNRIEGNRDISFAWSASAGVGYQLTDRATLDVGYRYIDLGSIDSGRVDSGGFVNPKVEFDDLGVHEIKVGLRYALGASEPATLSPYAPLK